MNFWDFECIIGQNCVAADDIIEICNAFSNFSLQPLPLIREIENLFRNFFINFIHFGSPPVLFIFLFLYRPKIYNIGFSNQQKGGNNLENLF